MLLTKISESLSEAENLNTVFPYSFPNSEETFQVGEKLMWKLGEFFIE